MYFTCRGMKEETLKTGASDTAEGLTESYICAREESIRIEEVLKMGRD